MSHRHRRVHPAAYVCAAGLTVALVTSPAPGVLVGLLDAGPGSSAAASGASSSSAWSFPTTRRPAHTSTRQVPPADALHVSRKGSDRASGSSRAPLRTIGAALGRADDGDTVVVHGGSYHESVEIEGTTGVTLMAAPRARVWLDGSRRVSGWTADAGSWVSSGWTPEFDASATYSWGEPDNTSEHWQFVDPAHPMAAHPDQVWIDGVRQEQVGSLAEVRPGTFFVDEEADLLHLGSDPTGREVRASALAKGLSVRAASTRVLGIGVRRYANSVPHMGAVTVEAPGARLVDVAVVENATGGLHVMDRRIRLLRVRVAGNGMMGMTATGADGLRIDRLRASGNNRERFNTSPAAGGAKIGRASDVVVRDSVFDANLGTGLWFDESVHGVEVLGGRMRDNAVHGISVELSGAVLVAGNMVADNGESGLKVNDTSDVSIWNNTFTGNDREVDIVQDDRDLDPQGSHLDHSLPLTFRNGPVVLRNNVFAQTARGSDCLLCVEDYSGRMSAEDMRVSARANLYQRPSADRPVILVRWSHGEDAIAFSSFAAFRSATGQERHGRLVTGKRVLRGDDRVTRAVDRLARRIARPLPASLATRLGVARGSRGLGAW